MPMTVNDYFAHFISQLHGWYRDALADLTEEQLYFRPADEGNHIAFQAWHFIRTKDNVINFVLQDRKAPLWMRQNLHEEWGMPKVAQGTGREPAEAHALRIPSIDALLKYADDVHADVMPWVESVSSDDLQVIHKLVPWGELPAVQHVGQTIVAHGNLHLGQINTLRAIQGLKGEDF